MHLAGEDRDGHERLREEYAILVVKRVQSAPFLQSLMKDFMEKITDVNRADNANTDVEEQKNKHTSYG